MAFVIVGSSSFAQLDASARLRPITAPVRNAGVLHLATGSWTRHAAHAVLGADVIYNNTCSSGYYAGFSGDTFVDEGRLPSPTSPFHVMSRPGCNTQYLVDGFQIKYCTDRPAATFGTYFVNFYQSYVNCTSVSGLSPTAAFALTGLPASSSAASACWTVDIDLAASSSGSLAFTMLADGDGSFTGSLGGVTNLFGWSMTSTALGTATGPFIAGDPNICSPFDGTIWDSPINYAEPGSGMSIQDNFYVEGPSSTPGCYWFGGSPFIAFHLKLYSPAACPPATGVVYCPGYSTGTACPCGNHSPVGYGLGCRNSSGVGGSLRATGDSSLAADTVVLAGAALGESPCLFFQGTTRAGTVPGHGVVFGDGLRCVAGTIVRIGLRMSVGASAIYPGPTNLPVSVLGFVTSAGTRTYQVWYRNAATFCASATFNLTNGYEIVWH